MAIVGLYRYTVIMIYNGHSWGYTKLYPMFRHTLSQASQTDEKNLHVPEVIPHPVAQKSRDLRIGIGATA
jgi:hypothetical protein